MLTPCLQHQSSWLVRKHRWLFAKPRADRFCSCQLSYLRNFCKGWDYEKLLYAVLSFVETASDDQHFLIGTPILWPFPGAAGGEQIDWSLDKCSITYYNLWQPNSAKLGFGHFWTCDFFCVEQGRSGKELSCNLHTLWGLSHCIFCTFNHERTLSEFQDM